MTADIAILLLRIGLGVTMPLHGWPKLKHPGWGNKMGIPTAAGFLVGFAEVFGGLGLLFGLFTRAAAAGPLLAMTGAIYFHAVKWKDPLVKPNKSSWEHPLLIWLVSLALLLLGGGAYSIDALIGLA